MACVAGTLFAQSVEAQQQPTFSTEVKVVNIFATVRDKNRQIVRNLTKNDFTVLENGRPESIRYFSQESDLPLTVGLLVDTSFSQGRVLEDERGASYRFLDQVLRENKDKAVIVQFDQAVVIRQGLTGSHKELQDTLALLDLPSAQQAANGSGTLLYDAVRTASIQVMRQRQGRKAFIVLTDGVDEGSEVTLTDAIEAAQRADTLVYSILFSDASYYGGLFAWSGRQARFGTAVPGNGWRILRGYEAADNSADLRCHSRGTAQRIQFGVCFGPACDFVGLSQNSCKHQAEGPGRAGDRPVLRRNVSCCSVSVSYKLAFAGAEGTPDGTARNLRMHHPVMTTPYVAKTRSTRSAVVPFLRRATSRSQKQLRTSATSASCQKINQTDVLFGRVMF